MSIYIGQDGRVRDDSLMHWKYIKKIKSGGGWRYFYTPEEVRAFYNESRKDIRDLTKKAKKTAYDVNQNYKAERMVADHKWARDTNKENRRHREQVAFEKKMYNDLRKSDRDAWVISRDKQGNLKIRDKTKKEKAASNKKYRTEEKLYQRRENLEHRVRTTKINAINKTAPVYKAAKNFVNGSYKQRTKSIVQAENRKGQQRQMNRLKSENALKEAKRREQEREQERKRNAEKKRKETQQMLKVARKNSAHPGQTLDAYRGSNSRLKTKKSKPSGTPYSIRRRRTGR